MYYTFKGGFGMFKTTREVARGMNEICRVCSNNECRGYIIANSHHSEDGVVIILNRLHEPCLEVVTSCEIFRQQYPLVIDGDLTGI